MAIFTPKVIATALSTGGVSVGGGGAILLKQMPKNYREQLTKEGIYLLSKDDEYKAIYVDHKDKDYWTSESDLKGASETDANTKLKTYCEGKLKDSVPWISTGNYTIQKKKLLNLCTSEGLNTVKARLIQSGKSGWIDPTNGTDKYKVIFSVYKYSPAFLNWLKEGGKNSDLKQNSKTSDKYTTLKDACENLLKRPYREIKDTKYFNYAYWWCTDIGYTTIKEKIKKTDPNWEEETESSQWENLKNTWKHTDEVKKWANKAKNQDESEELTNETIEALCKPDNVKSNLSEDESYKDKYLVIKSVCKKKSTSSP